MSCIEASNIAWHANASSYVLVDVRFLGDFAISEIAILDWGKNFFVERFPCVSFTKLGWLLAGCCDSLRIVADTVEI